MKPLLTGLKLWAAVLVLAAGLSLGPGPAALAQERGFMGRVVRVEGYGIVVRSADGVEIPASPGLNLFSGDKVSTGPLSEIRLITADGSLFWLGEETLVELGDLEISPQGDQTTLMINLPTGYLKTVAESYDKSRLSTVQVWTENAVAAIAEDAMVVIESPEGTKVIGFDYPARIYGREQPDRVETTMDQKVCLVPDGEAALPAREMSQSERFLFNRLFVLGKEGPPESKPGKGAGGVQKVFFPSSTTTTTTTTTNPRSTTTTTIVSTTTTTSVTTTTTSTIPLLPQQPHQ